MSTIHEFEDLEIWQLAREQCRYVNGFIKVFLIHKEFELVSQVRRSSGSVMDNIAEGFERGGNPEFINFLSISKGSNGELRSQFYRALDLNLICQSDFNNFEELNKKLGKRIFVFMQYLKNAILVSSYTTGGIR
jgi:four helix bundle protein